MTDDITRNYHGGNEESEQANESITGTKEQMRTKLYDALKRRPSTCEELEDRFGMKHQTVSARLSELKRDGLVEKVGTRPTSSGRSAAVLAPKQAQRSLGLF